MSRPSMFSGNSNSPRATNTNNRSEIDLRTELDNLLYGPDIAHAHMILIQNMRVDSNNHPVRCTCLLTQTTINPDPNCSYCFGQGFLYDETWHMCYSYHTSSEGGDSRKYLNLAPGKERTDYIVFILRYTTTIRYEDKIVEIKLDEEGQPIIPYIRIAFYKPQTIKQMRSDSGRLEYLAVYCLEDDAIRGDNY